MRSISKLIYVLLDDRISIYSNSLIDRIVASSENLARFGTIISRMDMESIRYVIPVLVKIMECNPEEVICNLFGDRGLQLSRLLYESSEKKVHFEYMLEFYLHILNVYPNEFRYLLVDKGELSLNILKGIERMTMFLAKSSKYSNSQNYQISRNWKLSKLGCMQHPGSIPVVGDFLMSDNHSDSNNMLSGEDAGERGMFMGVYSSGKNTSMRNESQTGSKSNEAGELEDEQDLDGATAYGILRREDDDNSLMKNLIVFFKGFMIHKERAAVSRMTEREIQEMSNDEELELERRCRGECRRSEWLMEGESFEVVNKIIEWIIELLRNSIEIDLDSLALDCILQIFTREECRVHEERLEVESSSEFNSLKSNTTADDDSSDSPIQELETEINSRELVINAKPLGIKSKRVTFKRIEEIPSKKKINVDKKLRVNACINEGAKNVGNTGIEKTRSCGRLCFHQIFVIKHGQYLLDILLELFDDYLRKFGLNHIRKKVGSSLNMSIYDHGYKYITENEQKIEELLYKILRGMNSISEGVAIQSCPRQVFALCWFMDFILNSFFTEELILNSRPPIPLHGSSSMDMVMNSTGVEQPLEHVLITVSSRLDEDPGQSSQAELFNPASHLSQQQIKIADQIISIIENICRLLYIKSGGDSNLEEYTSGDFYRVDIKKLWKLNGTIYSRDHLLQYFSNILQITQKLCGIKGIRLIQFLESTDKLFEFHSKVLKSREQNIISLIQLCLIQDIFDKNQSHELEIDDSFAKGKDSHASFVYNIFSIVLQIDKRVRDNMEDSDEVNDQIVQKAVSKIRLLINNKVGAQLILRWIKDPSIGNQEIYGIRTDILTRWIVHISRQLLDPLLSESEINSRLKYLNKERIRAALLLDESASSDTISIVISLLAFSHGYLPDQVTHFILRNINREEIRDFEYQEVNEISEDIAHKIQNYGKPPVFGEYTGRNIPARVLLYYSSILLERSFKTDESIAKFQRSTLQRDRIIVKIVSTLISTNIRRREWLLWHSKDFDKIGNFSDSLCSLIQARGAIGSYQEQKKAEELIFKWMYDRNMDYSRYQVVSSSKSVSCFCPGLIEFSISPILERSILENISFIKFEIKQLLNLSSVKISASGEYEIEEFTQNLNMYLNLFIFSIQSYLDSNLSQGMDDQLTVEEVTLPLKLFLNINRDDCDFRIKALIGHLTLRFISIFFVPRWRRSNSKELKSSESPQLLASETLRVLECFGQSSSRSNTSMLLVLVNLMDEITRWVNDVFNMSNIDKFDMSTYLETLSSLIFELGLKGSSISEMRANESSGDIVKFKVRQSLINLVQSDSMRLMLEKVFHYILICRRRSNHLDASRPSLLIVVTILLISMFLSKFQVALNNDRFGSLIYLILTHPTLVYHMDKASRCEVATDFKSDESGHFCDLSHTSSKKPVSLCEHCFRFGLNSVSDEIKLITMISFIVSSLNQGQGQSQSRSISRSNLARELYLQSISGVLNTGCRSSALRYGYIGTILSEVYLSNDQIHSLSLIHNLYIQKFLVKEFISDILNSDRILSEGASLSPCMVFHYSVMFSYLVFILKITPWWFNISDLVNLAFINRLGRIYRSLQGSAIPYDESDMVEEYLLGLTEILLKIMLEAAKRLADSGNAHPPGKLLILPPLLPKLSLLIGLSLALSLLSLIILFADGDRNAVGSIGVLVKIIQDILKNQATESIQEYNLTLVREHASSGAGGKLKCVSDSEDSTGPGCLICFQSQTSRQMDTGEKLADSYFIGQVLKLSTVEMFKRIVRS
ncbi:hypothetical protein OJ253_475 [Cryptosporidium canis]|uniref:Uncharacterized protein n=1 Tax=Cryptosporidium canis TaxID=195482 RepID=A0A9D5DIQ2_9CRYT|nr:hypothetical protein OJ253_475 [Cryptosporidium canis]